jgi:hypothetical protein
LIERMVGLDAGETFDSVYACDVRERKEMEHHFKVRKKGTTKTIEGSGKTAEVKGTEIETCAEVRLFLSGVSLPSAFPSSSLNLILTISPPPPSLARHCPILPPLPPSLLMPPANGKSGKQYVLHFPPSSSSLHPPQEHTHTPSPNTPEQPGKKTKEQWARKGKTRTDENACTTKSMYRCHCPLCARQ